MTWISPSSHLLKRRGEILCCWNTSLFVEFDRCCNHFVALKGLTNFVELNINRFGLALKELTDFVDNLQL